MIGAGDETRFMMLETIREYALEKLTPERETVCNAHAAYYVDLAGRNDSETLQRLNDQSLMLAQLSAEHENFYAAFEWLLNSGQGAEVLKAGAALWRFWLITGRSRAGLRWMKRGLALAQNVSPQLKADGLRAAANLAMSQMDAELNEVYLNEALMLYRDLDDVKSVAACLPMQATGYIYSFHPQLELAGRITEKLFSCSAVTSFLRNSKC